MTFNEIDPKSITENPFDVFGKKWPLVAAGTQEKYNMMTIGWGTLGILWGQPVAVVFIRPSRYTYEFMEKQDTFSVNVLSEQYKDVLNLCGSKSGREIDKMNLEKLTVESHKGTPFFQQSDLVLICKKWYTQDFQPDTIPPEVIPQYYANGDFHRVYYGKIEMCFHL